MPKCPLNPAAIQRYVLTGLRPVARSRDLQQAKDYTLKCIDWINDSDTGFIITDSKDSLIAAEAILSIFNKTGFPAMDPDFFLVTNIQNAILGVRDNVLQSDKVNTSTDRLTDTEEVFIRSQANKLFLDDAYGLAKDAKLFATAKANLMMFDAMFINRGSIQGVKLGIVANDPDLNINIRQYQQQLFEDIVKYLDASSGSEEAELKTLLQNSPKMFDDENELSATYKALLPYIKERLRNSTMTTDLLRTCMEAFTKNPDSLDGQHLKAYNAWVLLSNFDSYVDSLFGKIIKILNFNKLGGTSKYSLQSSTANVNKTWRTNDNIIVSDEVDKVTQLLINTTPLYSAKNHSEVKGSFVTFLDFEYLMGKIKDLIYNPAIHAIEFGEDWQDDNIELWNSLSEQTREVLENKRLSTAINSIRFNPRKTVHAFFELFSNEAIIRTFNLEGIFSNDEKNKLFSLNRAIFNPLNSDSIYTLTENALSHNFYEYLTQVADSIFKIKYLQYYLDSDGTVKIRTLLDANVYNIERKVKQTINGSNHKMLFPSYETFQSKYNAITTYSDNGTPKIVYVSVPGTLLRAAVTLNTGDVTWENDGRPIKNLLGFYDSNLEFLDDVLHIGLENNSQMSELIAETLQSEANRANLLFNLAARTLAISSVNQTYFKDKPIKDIVEGLSKVFGKQVTYDYNLDQLNLIMDRDKVTITNIAQARSNLLGMTTASIVRDGSGNALSNQSLSRLMGSYPSLFDLLIMANANSAMHNSILMTETGLFKGIYTAKEFHSDTTDKNVVVMTPAEMAYASIVHDFIGGLLQSYTAIGNGVVGFLPSVNSDKNTAGRILIDLNTKIHDKALVDYTISEILGLIAEEFGKIYTLMWDNVIEDWKKLDGVCQSIGMTPFSKDFSKGFENINAWWEKNRPGLSLSEFIKNAVLLINEQDRLHPITLIDLVHFIEKKDSSGKKNLIGVNETFAALIARWSPSRAQRLGIRTSLYASAQEFWKKKNQEILISLLKNNFVLNTTDTSSSPLLYIRENYPDWVNSSGNMILAKVDGVPVTNVMDFSENYLIVISKAKSVEVNPILERYNLFDYLFTQEWMNSTVGSFIAHPNKSGAKHTVNPNDKKYNWEHRNIVLEQEASQFGALHKRNVSFTAAMYAFLLNTLEGIPDTYNIAVIDDIDDAQGTIPGAIGKIKPFDGATFVNPFVVYLENNSLGGSKVGITKKLFVHFYDERTGTGGIIKTAGFGLTNDWIRNSEFLQRMMRKMTSHKWINEDGSAAVVDITRDYNGNYILYDDIYYKENGIAYKVIASSILSTGANKYSYSILNQETGAIIPKSDVTIDNNYDLWKFFGGEYSLHETEKGLEYSNTSVENVVKAINHCASINPITGEFITKSKNGRIATQEDIWLPLKHSDIHYMPTAGAVKQGAANINSKAKYYTEENDLNILRIKMYQSGVQLDKEHHADQSEISMMTLVISACAARGYTFEASTMLYDALRKATDHGLFDHFSALEEYFESKTLRDSLREIVMKSLIDNLGNSSVNSGNFAQAMAADIIREAKAGKKIVYKDLKLPLSDPTVRAKVISTVSVFLTNSGIKNKIPGILSVLTPSHEIFKLYNNKKLENISQEELLEAQKNVPEIVGSTFVPEIKDGQRVLFGEVIPEGVDVESFIKHKLTEYYPRKAYSGISVIPINKEVEITTASGQMLVLHPKTAIEALDIRKKIQDGEFISALESQKEYTDRIVDEYEKRIFNISKIELGRTYNLIKSDGSVESRLINTPIDYRNLKQLVRNKIVVSVKENLLVGRNLAAYNVRFRGHDLTSYQIWDLDSVKHLSQFDVVKGMDNWVLQVDVLKRYLPEFGYSVLSDLSTLEQLATELPKIEAHLRKKLLRDLGNLSGTENSDLEEIQTMIDEYVESGRKNKHLLSTILTAAALRLGMSIDSITSSFEKYSEDMCFARMVEMLRENKHVIIDGTTVRIDQSSIEVQPYEIIMPKTFAKNFGLSEFDDLNTISLDKDWFIKQAIQLKDLGRYKYKIDRADFTIKLHNSDGYHQYLMHKSLLPRSKNLTRLENVMTAVIDEKTYRVDADGNTMYQIHDPANDEIYTDGEHEVIVTNNIIDYVENMHYDNLQFSPNMITYGNLTSSLMTDFSKSKKKKVQRFYNAVKGKSTRDIIINSNSLYNLTLENYNNPLYAEHPIVKAGREKHSSFLKSLDIIGARIPAQSMQSFMPMKVVAFDNPDINTAHVSTMLILLLGSKIVNKY